MRLQFLVYNLILSASVLGISACDNQDEPTSTVTIPVLTTTQVYGITSLSATSGGNITSDGGAAVTARGVCWSTNSNPTINDNTTADGSSIGSFTSSITGLTENTTYHVRAYATNNEGTGYGNDVAFTTLSSSGSNALEYLGQTPPGMQFVRFAPNIIADEMIHSITVSPDGQEIYWAERSGIKFTKIENGHWTTPAFVSFSGGNTNFYDDAPAV